jgi:hypothetical protein
MPQFRYARKYRAAASGGSRGTDAVSDVGQTGLDTLHVLGWNRRTQLIQHGICWEAPSSTFMRAAQTHGEQHRPMRGLLRRQRRRVGALCPTNDLRVIGTTGIHHTRLPAISPVSAGMWVGCRSDHRAHVRYHSRCSKCWLEYSTRISLTGALADRPMGL